MKNLLKDDKSWTHWQWYKKFFSIVIIKYLITWFAIVPLFAKLLSKLPDELTFKILCEKYVIPLALPFKWEFMWFASFLFVIAYVLYLFYCPRFIKTYSSFKDYLSHNHSPRWISWISKDLIKSSDENNIIHFHNRLLVKGYLEQIPDERLNSFIQEDKTQDDASESKTLPNVYVRGKETTLVYKLKDQLYALNMPIVNNDQEIEKDTKIAEREIFWEVFGRFSSTRRGIRRSIIILLLISLFLFSIAVIENIITAISYFS